MNYCSIKDAYGSLHATKHATNTLETNSLSDKLSHTEYKKLFFAHVTDTHDLSSICSDTVRDAYEHVRKCCNCKKGISKALSTLSKRKEQQMHKTKQKEDSSTLYLDLDMLFKIVLIIIVLIMIY